MLEPIAAVPRPDTLEWSGATPGGRSLFLERWGMVIGPFRSCEKETHVLNNPYRWLGGPARNRSRRKCPRLPRLFYENQIAIERPRMTDEQLVAVTIWRINRKHSGHPLGESYPLQKMEELRLKIAPRAYNETMDHGTPQASHLYRSFRRKPSEGIVGFDCFFGGDRFAPLAVEQQVSFAITMWV
jgi:hypothetical protein